MWRYLDPDSFTTVGCRGATTRPRARAGSRRTAVRRPDGRPGVTAESVLRWLREDDRRDALTPWLPVALEARRRRQTGSRRIPAAPANR
jgi:hypothetical protein